ncbi:hypothetical protein TcWFU_009229 [Taenia crassiceps]|uniref:protein phosphatase methylesterase-1 n=1 Tax=Taenia crassiceps TaxID=6207 RepID=A0ABR4QU06_9CEST
MSDLLRRQFVPRLKNSDNAQSMGRRSVSYIPQKWNKYFNIRDDVEITSGTYRIYRRGVEGPLLFFIHGGGFSALSWSLLSKAITEDVRCQCLAVDMRGHGDTKCKDESDYSIETLANDIIQIIFAMFPTEAPPIILIGHSMGGAVAVHVAQKRAIPSFAGLVVVDVVEGTALESLYSMTSFLRSRPQGFRSLVDGISWCVRSGQIHNVESACISFPGQLKRVATGESATRELDKGTALIDASDPCGPISCPSSSSTAPISHSTKPFTSSTTSTISEEEEPEENEETSIMPRFVEKGNGEMKPSQSLPLSHPLPSMPTPAAETAVRPPTSVSDATGAYTWRIDLSKTEPFWRGWFSNMSSLFLSVPEPKLLLVAGVDRLDKELTIAQMQGKFQLKILPRAGHAIHEDSPDEVASCLAHFLLRNQFTGAKPNLFLRQRSLVHIMLRVAAGRSVVLQNVYSARQLHRHGSTKVDRAGGRNRVNKLENLIQWWIRLKPWQEELATLKRRLRRQKAGFDPNVHGQTRYLVRFPQLTESDFRQWRVFTDADFDEGYSTAEFVRSPRGALGSTAPDHEATGFVAPTTFRDAQDSLSPSEKDKHPFSIMYSADRPQRLPNPASPESYVRSTLFSLDPPRECFNAGYGLFRGNISTRVPERGDLVRSGFAHLRSPEHTQFGFLMEYNFYPYTHLVIRYRGDGRTYRLNIHPKTEWDAFWFDMHQFPLYTRGGPYWCISKLPLSAFYLINKGTVVDRQHRIAPSRVRMISFTLADRLPGPFALEIDYIALYHDRFHKERFAYEQYDAPAIVKDWRLHAFSGLDDHYRAWRVVTHKVDKASLQTVQRNR